MLIAESDLNDPRVVQGRNQGGYGMNAQWSDDFHHALHAVLTGESHGYYADFGQLAHLAKTYNDVFVYNGIHSPARKRVHGKQAGTFRQSGFSLMHKPMIRSETEREENVCVIWPISRGHDSPLGWS